jgi:hypothetical protein
MTNRLFRCVEVKSLQAGETMLQDKLFAQRANKASVVLGLMKAATTAMPACCYITTQWPRNKKNRLSGLAHRQLNKRHNPAAAASTAPG